MNNWLTFPRPNREAHFRLFCFPYSGAGTSIFYTWPKILAPLSQVELGLIQYPGRESRLAEPCITRLPLLVEKIAENIQPYLDKPFAFYGHSLGGLVSYELTRFLRRNGRPQPFHLFISSHAAPHLKDIEPAMYDLPDTEFKMRLEKLSGMKKEVLQNDELMQIVLPILRADFEICDTYTHHEENPLDCPISVYGGLQDQEVPNDSLKAWQTLTHSKFIMRMFPGNHFFLNEERQLLIETIARELIADFKSFNLN